MPSVNQILEAIGQRGAVAENRPPLKVVPTRLPSFNTEVMKLGCLALGRVYELYAPHSAGKSTLAQIFCADFQREGKIAAYFDVEATTQTESDQESKQGWMESLGVDAHNLIMPSFGSAEECFNLVKQLIYNRVNIIVIDTIAVLMPEIMIFRESETMKMNEGMARAKALTTFFNDIVGGFQILGPKGKPLEVPTDICSSLAEHGVTIRNRKIHKLWYYDCALIGINHAKTMVGVMWGDPTYSPGGDALGFHSTVRLGMSKPVKSKEKVKVGGYEVSTYRRTTITAAKNKLAAPFGEMCLRVYQNGKVEEDVPFFALAEQKGLVRVTKSNVVILVGDYAGTTLKKVEFEQWVAENPTFLETVDESVEVEMDATASAPIDTAAPPAKKISLGGFKKIEMGEESTTGTPPVGEPPSTSGGLKLKLGLKS